jgi:hypothetical protein
MSITASLQGWILVSKDLGDLLRINDGGPEAFQWATTVPRAHHRVISTIGAYPRASWLLRKFPFVAESFLLRLSLDISSSH